MNRIALTRLKRSKAGMRWAFDPVRAEKRVMIRGGGWYWRPNRSGHTDQASEAGVYTFADALDASSHCGAEKSIVYEFVEDDRPLTQEPKGPAMLMLRTRGVT